MDNRNPYEVLGVPSDASPDEVKAAYRALSLRFHPDRMTGLSSSARDDAAARMKALNAAYAVLKNPAKRAALDRKLARASKKIIATPPPPGIPEVDVEPPAWSKRTAREAPTPFAHRAAHQPPPPPAPAQVVFPRYRPSAMPNRTDTPAPTFISAVVAKEDMARFLGFAIFTSLGWCGVVLVAMILPPPVTLMAVLGFSTASIITLSLVKPAFRRQPLGVGNLFGRALMLLLLILVALIAFVVFPQVAAGLPSVSFQLLLQIVGLAFALVVHWGVCMVTYRLI